MFGQWFGFSRAETERARARDKQLRSEEEEKLRTGETGTQLKRETNGAGCLRGR
jgi:hypothetical protein